MEGRSGKEELEERWWRRSCRRRRKGRGEGEEKEKEREEEQGKGLWD